MTQKIINIGSAPNDGSGDSLRVAFNKVNSNFTELYTTGAGASSGGYVGSRGREGYVGSKGFTGSSGFNGSSGFIGSFGYTGSRGIVDLGAVGQHIIPSANITYDLGSATNRFRDIYLSTNTINLGTNSISVGSSGQLLVNGNNAATQLIYFGGEGFGSRDASSMAWGTQDESAGGLPCFLVNGPGVDLTRALYELQIGDKIGIGTSQNNISETLTVTGLPVRPSRAGYSNSLYVPVNRAPSNSSPANFYYALYLPVRDASTAIVNNAKSLMLLPSGYVVFPTVTVPAHSYGVAGDVAGMVAFDSAYIYFCTANYVDNSTNIWKRTAHGTGTW
jgi:hypothetical protein